MATRYADRAFLSINGARLIDVQSASLKQNLNARIVPTMTPDNFNRGFVRGNRDIDLTFVLAVQNQLARPKIENIDFENNDVQMTFIAGANQWVAKGLFNKDAEDNAPGIGDEVKSTFNCGAVSIQDAVGNSILFNIGL